MKSTIKVGVDRLTVNIIDEFDNAGLYTKVFVRPAHVFTESLLRKILDGFGISFHFVSPFLQCITILYTQTHLLSTPEFKAQVSDIIVGNC
jgi:hypothetical protein